MNLAPEPVANRKDSFYQFRERSPHPYLLHEPKDRNGINAASGQDEGDDHRQSSSGDGTPYDSARRRSHAGTASESGTEADDEGPHFLKALPPATLKPRKGLKYGEGTVSPLLTPSQLDIHGRQLARGYFDPRTLGPKRAQSPDEEEFEIRRRKFETRRRSERIRRLSEAALVGAIGLIVGFTPLVASPAWKWQTVALISQALAVVALILAYPLRLLSLKHDEGELRVSNTFHVPPSFDPANILYPTFLPVIISLSLLPTMPGLLMPNLILGLASLPPRLFPASSRVLEFNALHWMVSLTPLISTRAFGWLSRRYFPGLFGDDFNPVLTPEVLSLLYPMHQSLLPSLYYLTTTSLLPAEVHLLSVSLINLMVFATAPQAIILSTMLWTGGVPLLALCLYVLRWNVALARVPQWRFRDRRLNQKDRSLLAELVGSFLSMFRSIVLRSDLDSRVDSDGDEDEADASAARRSRRSPSLRIISDQTLDSSLDPRSTIETSTRGSTQAWDGLHSPTYQKRRNTFSSVNDSVNLLPDLGLSKTERRRSRRRDWSLTLTPRGARIRQWMYAGYTYASILSIALLAVRHKVAQRALQGSEPVFWALDYLFAGLPAIYQELLSLPDYSSSTLVAKLSELDFTDSTIPSLRLTVGASNTRLLLVIYWLLVLSVGLITVLLLTASIEVDTRRKIFHGIMVTMLLPSTFVDPCFCALTLSLVLAVFLLLEVLRAGQVQPLGSAIGRFVAPYVDGRDLRGPVVVSHIFLLIGCAVPLWLSLAAVGRAGTGWEIEGECREVAMVSGTVCVGMGDAAASLIGRRYGRRKWPWVGGKSLEGSAAFAVAVTFGLMAAKVWMVVGGWADLQAQNGRSSQTWLLEFAKSFAAGCGASFMEAVLTGANDNVVVPVALWLLVRGFGL